MSRRGLLLTLGILGGSAALAWGQAPFPPQLQVAINQLTTGVIPFTAPRLSASSYQNWGTTQGVNGYGAEPFHHRFCPEDGLLDVVIGTAESFKVVLPGVQQRLERAPPYRPVVDDPQLE